MPSTRQNSLVSLMFLTLASIVSAKTDISGCTSSQVVTNGGASLIYFVPGTGEICSFLDCGGGQAPPKTDVPGCPLYTGTATITPSYLRNANAASATTTPPSSPTSSEDPLLIDTASLPSSYAQITGSLSSLSITTSMSMTTMAAMPSSVGTGAITLVDTSLTDSSLLIATGSAVAPPATPGVDGSGSFTSSASGAAASSSSSTIASTNAAAAVRRGSMGVVGALAGLVVGVVVIL